MKKFDDFLEYATDLGVVVTSHDEDEYYAIQRKTKAKPFIRSEAWVTGGMSGGNCWDSEASTIYWTEEAKELIDLDVLLQKIAPDMTYLQYKELIRELDVKRQTYSVNEYYGNYTDHEYKYIELDHLHDVMIKLGHIK